MEEVAFTIKIQSVVTLYSTSSSQSAGFTALGSAIRSSVTQSEEQKETGEHRVIRREEEVEKIQNKRCFFRMNSVTHQSVAVQCSAVQCSADQCSADQCSADQCSTV